MAVLPHTAHGPEGRTPIVLLHGFGAERTTWLALQVALENRRRTIAFDLPGHGEAVGRPEVGGVGQIAKAVGASLDELGLSRIHLVGHSMGGAVAALLALRSASLDRIASLTLLSPGGFGPEINYRLLRRYGTATDAAEIEAALEQMFGAETPVPSGLAQRLAAERRDPRRVAAAEAILPTMLDGNRQKTLDAAALGALPHPIKVVWGAQDRVLPTRHAHNLPGIVATHVFPGVGHMIHLEIPRETARLVLESAAAE